MMKMGTAMNQIVDEWWEKNNVFTTIIDDTWIAAYQWFYEDPPNRVLITPQGHDPQAFPKVGCISVGEVLKEPSRVRGKQVLFVDAVQILKTIFHVENVYGALVLDNPDTDDYVIFENEVKARTQEMLAGILEKIDD